MLLHFYCNLYPTQIVSSTQIAYCVDNTHQERKNSQIVTCLSAQHKESRALFYLSKCFKLAYLFGPPTNICLTAKACGVHVYVRTQRGTLNLIHKV